jgi:hypothetical protein
MVPKAEKRVCAHLFISPKTGRCERADKQYLHGAALPNLPCYSAFVSH